MVSVVLERRYKLACGASSYHRFDFDTYYIQSTRYRRLAFDIFPDLEKAEHLPRRNCCCFGSLIFPTLCLHIIHLVTRDFPVEVMGDQTIQPTAESPEIIAFATRMYDAARQGDTAIFEQVLPAGLPPNMTNDKGDSLVRSSPTSLTTCHPSSSVS